MPEALNQRTQARIESIVGNPFLSNAGKRDQIYTTLVEAAGLAGKAFFGHRKSRAETKRLAYFWRAAQKYVPESTKREAAVLSEPLAAGEQLHRMIEEGAEAPKEVFTDDEHLQSVELDDVVAAEPGQ